MLVETAEHVWSEPTCTKGGHMTYVESNSRAIVYPAAGVVQLLPVVLNDANEPFVQSFDRYVRPEDVNGFQRVEVFPQYKKKEIGDN